MEYVQCVTGTAGHIKAIDKHTHAGLHAVLIMNRAGGSKPSLKLLE